MAGTLAILGDLGLGMGLMGRTGGQVVASSARRAGLDPEVIGDILAAWRAELAQRRGVKVVSQADVGKLAGLSQRAVYDMERGASLRIENLDRLLPVYGRTLVDLGKEIEAVRETRPDKIESRLDELTRELGLVRRLAEKAQREGASAGRKRNRKPPPPDSTD